MKKFIFIFICLLTFVFVGCNTPVGPEPDGPEVPANKVLESLSLSGKTEISVNEKITLEAVYDAEIEVDLVWSSSNETVLKVTGNEAKGLKDGVATVTVKDNISGISATLDIKVGLGEVNIDTLLEWAINEMGVEGYDEVEIPFEHPTIDCTYEWISSDSDLFDVESGYLGFNKTDDVVTLTCIANYNGQTKEKTYEFTVLGYAAFDVVDEFMSQFKANKVFYDVVLQKEFNLHGGATIEVTSSDESIFSNEGILNKPLYETPIELALLVKIPSLGVEKIIKETVYAQPLTIQEKCEKVEQWIKENVSKDGYLYKDAVLPKYVDEYECSLEWFNESGTELKLDFSVDNPILGEGIKATILIKDGINSQKVEMTFKTITQPITDQWEKIELFVNTIASSALTSYTYSLVSWSDFEKGYIPFITEEGSNIIHNELPYTYGKQRTGIKKTSTEYVVVHDTGNPSKGATAKMHDTYITNLNNSSSSDYISWHFTVGNDGIYRHLPLDEVGYHAGDGSHVFGDVYHNTSYGKEDCIGGGNRNGIGIESCINEGSDYTYTMRILAELVAELLIEFDLGFDRVKQHNDFSGKNCPQVIREARRWNEFMYLVKLEYFMKTELKGVKFEWTSLTPDLMDNTGKVIKKISVGTTVSYKVKVTYEGESKEFTFQSTMAKRA